MSMIDTVGPPASGSPISLADLQGSKARHRREGLVKFLLWACAAVSLLISFAIVASLVGEAWVFLSGVEADWLSGSKWAPALNEYDLKTPLVGSLVVTGIAMLVAIPIGLTSAMYLSEYAQPAVRKVIKPTLEILAGIPSVVLGFFALQWIAPNIVQRLSSGASLFSYLAAGLGVGVLTIPLIASITEDALSSVPDALRQASAGIGAKKVTTTLRVVLPAAVSGIVAAMIIGISRAIGETMVVFIAAGGGGNQNPFNASVFEAGTTMTAAMATTATVPSDRLAGGVSEESLYFLGLLLFLITLSLNLVADRFVRRVRTAY